MRSMGMDTELGSQRSDQKVERYVLRIETVPLYSVVAQQDRVDGNWYASRSEPSRREKILPCICRNNLTIDEASMRKRLAINEATVLCTKVLRRRIRAHRRRLE